MMWAMELLKKKQGDQASALSDDPTAHIHHLFQHPNTTAEVCLQEIQCDCQIGIHLLCSLESADLECHERKMAMYQNYRIFIEATYKRTQLCLSQQISLDLEQLVGDVPDIDHEDE